MNLSSSSLAPCIVDIGTVIRKRDMHRLLTDLGRVRYQDIVDHNLIREGEGYVMEVYADTQSATMIANAALYLNVYSFDYLVLSVEPPQPNPEPLRPENSSHDTPTDPETVISSAAVSQAVFDLVQENRILRLIPLSNPLLEPPQPLADAQALKVAMVDWINQHLNEEDEDWHDGFISN